MASYKDHFMGWFEVLKLRHGASEAFRDFLEATAIAVSNAFDTQNSERREGRFHEVMRKYSSEEQPIFANLLREIKQHFAENPPHDFLGEIFIDLGLGEQWGEDFFIPSDRAFKIGEMMLKEKLFSLIREEGFLTCGDPSCGGGSLLIGMVRAMQEAGLDPYTQLHVNAMDSDPRCVHMAYVQLSLLSIPAIVEHGNFLTGESWARWYTPTHLAGGWGKKLDDRFGTLEIAPQSLTHELKGNKSEFMSIQYDCMLLNPPLTRFPENLIPLHQPRMRAVTPTALEDARSHTPQPVFRKLSDAMPQGVTRAERRRIEREERKLVR